MAEAALTFVAFATFGVLLGRGWDFAAVALGLGVMVALSRVAGS